MGHAFVAISHSHQRGGAGANLAADPHIWGKRQPAMKRPNQARSWADQIATTKGGEVVHFVGCLCIILTAGRRGHARTHAPAGSSSNAARAGAGSCIPERRTRRWHRTGLAWPQRRSCRAGIDARGMKRSATTDSTSAKRAKRQPRAALHWMTWPQLKLMIPRL